MISQKITLSQKAKFEKFLGLRRHTLCAYNFCNIFTWIDLYKIFSVKIDDCLCVFFRDNLGCFAYLAPLGKIFSPGAAQKCFEIMDSFNSRREFSRIENVEEEDALLYRKFGYCVEAKPGDYLCKRESLAGLRGDKFKSKRSAVNIFARTYKYLYRPFTEGDTDEVVSLYRLWAAQRQAKYTDKIYCGMIRDALSCQKVALRHFRQLGLIGRVVEADGRIAAYTIGYQLTSEIFCVFFEISDLNIKGAAQFIFRSLCQELDCKYVNIMDDSGLENLKKVKLSYYPVRVEPSYIIKRNDA